MCVVSEDKNFNGAKKKSNRAHLEVRTLSRVVVQSKQLACSFPIRWLHLLVCTVLALFAPVACTSYLISTYAGGSSDSGMVSDNVRATASSLSQPHGVWVDSLGSLYVADISSNRVRKVDVNGIISTYAGTGDASTSGDNGVPSAASLNQPLGVWSTSTGKMYVTEYSGVFIRTISSVSIITTYAGVGATGYSGDNGPATSAYFKNLYLISGDTSGIVYVFDGGNHCVRAIATNGIIKTIAGTGNIGYNGENLAATSSSLSNSRGGYMDTFGVLYVSEFTGNRVRKVSSGIMTTFAGTGTSGYNGVGPATSVQLTSPYGLFSDSAGSVFIGGNGDNIVRQVVAGTVTNAAGTGTAGFYGDGGPATVALISGPSGIWETSTGNLYFVSQYSVRKLTNLTPTAMPTAAPTYASVAAPNQYLTSNVFGTGYNGNAPENADASAAAIDYPFGIWQDTLGSLYVSDNSLSYVKKITSNIVTTFAGTGDNSISNGDTGPATSVYLNCPGGLWGNSVGTLFMSDMLNYKIRAVSISSGTTSVYAGTGSSVSGGGNGGPATSASFSSCYNIVGDSMGSLYFVDNDSTVRKVSAGGIVTNVAGIYSGNSGDGGPATSALFTTIRGLTLSPYGSLFIGDMYSRRVRVVSVSQVVSSFAGSGVSGFNGDGVAATSANLEYPYGIVLESTGALYICDTGSYRVRMVSASTVYTIAGTGVSTSTGDGGMATAATFNSPTLLFQDTSGNIVLTDRNARKVKKLTNVSPTVSPTFAPSYAPVSAPTQYMISRFAGTGSVGYFGDNGPATSATIGNPVGIWQDSLGVMYIADYSYNKVRKVSASGIITLFFGVGGMGSTGDGGMATAAAIMSLVGIWGNSAGFVYLVDSNGAKVRGVVASSTLVSTVVGTGTPGFSGDGFGASSSMLSIPTCISGDTAGNVYMADNGNYRVRKIASNGIISTYCGTGSPGISGDGGPSTSATIYYLYGIFAEMGSGSMLLADYSANRIRMISSTLIISTVVGSGGSGFNGDGKAATASTIYGPYGMSYVSGGALFFADQRSYRVRYLSSLSGTMYTIAGTGSYGMTGDNGMATAASLSSPIGVFQDSNGVVYVSDSDSHVVRKLVSMTPTSNPTQTPTTVMPTTTLPTVCPSVLPTVVPTTVGPTFCPSVKPTVVPTTTAPSVLPTVNPTLLPTMVPTVCPTTSGPTVGPTVVPTLGPSVVPSVGPTIGPSLIPTVMPSVVPTTIGPTVVPTVGPTFLPSVVPSLVPTTIKPTIGPTAVPTVAPTVGPSAVPSVGPSVFPTVAPSLVPTTIVPSVVPTVGPTVLPSVVPSLVPTTIKPTIGPTVVPTAVPTVGPSAVPSVSPSIVPTMCPSQIPSRTPSLLPSAAPSTVSPSMGPSVTPSVGPTLVPSVAPSVSPTLLPSTYPSVVPSLIPSQSPSTAPSVMPAVYSMYLITQYAGSVAFGDYAGDGGATTGARLNEPLGIWQSTDGNMFIADSLNCRVRKVSSGIISTFAGTGLCEVGSNSGQASSVYLKNPVSVWGSTSGDTYVLEATKVKKIDASGIVQVYAGSDTSAFGGDGGPATSAQFQNAVDFTGDTSGNLYVSDMASIRVRMICSSAIVSTVAGKGSFGLTGIGGRATSAEMGYPRGIFLDTLGNMFIADNSQDVIRKVDSSRIIAYWAGLANSNGYNGEGLAGTSAKFFGLFGIAGDTNGNLFVGDSDNRRVRIVTSQTYVYTIAGNGVEGLPSFNVPSTSISLMMPACVSVDTTGGVYFTDSDVTVNVVSKLVSLAPTGEPSYLPSFVPSPIPSTGPVAAPTSYWSSLYAGNGAYGYSGDGGPATAANISSPFGVWMSTTNSLYIAQFGNCALRKVDSGSISTAAGNNVCYYYNSTSTGRATAVSIPALRDVWGSSVGNLFLASICTIRKVDTTGILSRFVGNDAVGTGGDGGPSTAAQLRNTFYVTGDTIGNVYVSDGGNYRIRKVDTSGIISTTVGTGVAGYTTGVKATACTIGSPRGIVVDTSGNLFYTEVLNHVLRRVDASSQIVTLLAGQPTVYGNNGDGMAATSTLFISPWGLAVDTAGTLFVMDYGNYRLRMITASSIIYTIAGTGESTSASIYGFATSTAFYAASHFTMDAVGNFYVSNRGSNTIIKLATLAPTQTPTISPTCNPSVCPSLRPSVIPSVAPSALPTTVSPSSMPVVAPTRFAIEIFAGTLSASGSTGNGGPATSAKLSTPYGVWQSSLGVTYLADGGNCVIRKIQSGIISVFAGTVGSCASGANGNAATATSLGVPFDLWSTSSGVLIFAEATQLRSVNGVTGQLASFGGTTSSGFYGDGGKVTSALFQSIINIGGDTNPNVFVSDGLNCRVRKIDTNGIVTTIIGTGLLTVSGDGVPGTSASVAFPRGIFVDTTGIMFLSDGSGHILRKYGLTTQMTTIWAGQGVSGFNGDGMVGTSTKFSTPTGLSGDANGNIFVADTYNYRLRMLTASAIIYTVAGTGVSSQIVTGVATSSSFGTSIYVFADTQGLIYVSDSAGQVIERLYSLTPTAAPTVSLNPTAVPSYMPVAAPVQYVIRAFAGTSGSAMFAGDGGFATAAHFNSPLGMWGSSTGYLYIADNGNNRVRVVQPSGLVSALCGNGIRESSGDGGSPTAASLILPQSVWADSQGNVYIAESVKIRKIDTDGIINTFAGSTHSCNGNPISSVATSVVFCVIDDMIGDSSGNLYVTDGYMQVIKVRSDGFGTVVSGSGGQESVFGVAATSVGMGIPQGVFVDTIGNLFLSDDDFSIIRKIAASTQIVSVYMGLVAVAGFNGDGLAATSSALTYPYGLAGDTNGNLFIADFEGHRIRMVSSTSTAYTIAGTGSSVSSGDNGMATAAGFSAPCNLFLETTGSLFVSDMNSNTVRKLWSLAPTAFPTVSPTKAPTRLPSLIPTGAPSVMPSVTPTVKPSVGPSTVPTVGPTTILPTIAPSIVPSVAPTVGPSLLPSVVPTAQPSVVPSLIPSLSPSQIPTRTPSHIPTVSPSIVPSVTPTTRSPTVAPSVVPSLLPSQTPSVAPSVSPSIVPSIGPTLAPTVQPSAAPSVAPSMDPTVRPSTVPSVSPSLSPTAQPSIAPTVLPSTEPSAAPSVEPSENPSQSPSCLPSEQPSETPSVLPSVSPTVAPTEAPSIMPSVEPSIVPSASPSVLPSELPSRSPTVAPTVVPTQSPSCVPSVQPTEKPSVVPSVGPSVAPSVVPSAQPSVEPSLTPSLLPTVIPSLMPSVLPSVIPTDSLTLLPSAHPTALPSVGPTPDPSFAPTNHPSFAPTATPSISPSFSPTVPPTVSPSPPPTLSPSVAPSVFPTLQPSLSPTARPSLAPSARPTKVPTLCPTALPIAVGSPSTQPSSAPSVSNKALWLESLQNVLIQLAVNAGSVARNVVYKELVVIEDNVGKVYGSSVQWSAALGDVKLTGYVDVPNSIQITVQESLVSSVKSVQCISAVKDILSELTSSQSSNNIEVACSGHSWRINSCSSGKAICVDCSDPCDSQVECTSSSTHSSFVVAPSVTPSCQVNSALRVLSVAFSSVQAAPQLLSLTASSADRYSISVAASLSASGTLYCGVFASSLQYVPLSIEEVQMQNFVSSTDAMNATALVVRGLSAATQYDLYCLSVSEIGVAMSYAQIAKTSVETSCCKTLSVSLSAASVTASQVVSGFFSLRVDAQPSSILQASVAVFSSDDDALVSSALFPAAVSFGGVGSPSVARVSLTGLSEGSYYCTVTLSGDSIDEFEVVSSSSLSFSVVAADSPLPAPVLQSAVFSNDGSYFTVTFSSATDKAGLPTTFPCSSLLSFSCSDVSTCQWTDTQSVKVVGSSSSISSSNCFGVGSPVSVASSASLRAACTSGSASCASWVAASSDVVVSLTSPSTAASPSVVISAPSIIGPCDSVTLDITGSTGSGGREWTSSSSVLVRALAGGDTTDLQQFVSANLFSSPPQAIPSEYLVNGETYNFVVVLCNFLDQCSQNQKKIVVIDSALPSVSLPGSAVRSIGRHLPVTIASVSSITTCSAGSVVRTNQGLTYSWSVFTAGVEVLGMTSSSKDPSKMLLPAYFLTANLQYQMVLTVTSESGQSSTASVDVLVSVGSVVALISGGSTRSVRSGEALVMDASTSYDENVADATGFAAGLSYAWSCYQSSPTFSDDCSSLFSGGSFADQMSVSLVAQSVGDSSSSSNNHAGVVTVTVFDSALTRSASASVTVSVLPSQSVVVAVTSSKASGVMNAGESLQLYASVDVPVAVSSGTVTWSVDAIDVDLDSVALSPVVSSLSTSTAASASTLVYMTFAPNSFPVGYTLTFSLTCHLDSSSSSSVQSQSSSVTIAINSPPQPGLFSVSPASAETLAQQFSFVAKQWVDSDLPLRYQFGIESQDGSSSFVSLIAVSEKSFGSIDLAAGLQSQSYAVTAVAQIFDSLSAYSEVDFAVQVLPGSSSSAMSAAELSAFVSSSLDAGSASADGLRQSVVLSSAVLNAVDCSGAADCSSLHRAECYATLNTCGKCLSGFVGDSEDSNTLCVDEASLSSAVDVPNKRCPADCSGHGVCEFVDIFTNQSVISCSVLNTTCKAVCGCDAGYSLSSSCNLTDSEVLARQEARWKIVAGLSALNDLEDVSEQSVTGLMAALSQVSQSTDELSHDSTLSLLQLSQTAVEASNEVGLSSQPAGMVLTTLDSLSTVLSESSSGAASRRHRRRLMQDAAVSAGVSQLTAVLQQYADYVSRSMVPGQYAVSSSLSNFKTTSQYVSAASSVLSLPLTPLEELSGQAASSIHVPAADASGASAATAMSLVSLLPSVFGGGGDSGSFNSNPLNVIMSSLPCAESPCELSVVLQNSRPVSLTALNQQQQQVPEYVNTTCVKGVSRVYNHTCSNGLLIPVINCTGLSDYVVHSRCPNVTYSQVCNTLSGSFANSDSGCRMTAQSESSITCSCLIASPSPVVSRRLLNSTSNESAAFAEELSTGSYSMSYVAMLHSIAHSFVSTVESAPSLNANTAEKSWSVILTIGSFAGAVLVAMLFSHRADKLGKIDQEEKKKTKAQQKHHDHIHRLMGSGHGPLMQKSRAHKIHQKKQKVNVELLMVEQSLPNILSNSISLQQRVISELKLKHRWFGIVFFFSESFPRVLRVASLATNVIIMLFIQSITYNLANPDDGSCQAYETQAGCESQKSPFATGESKCRWHADHQTCSFIEPSDSIKIVLFVAVFSAIVSTPIALSADWILHKLISAPVKKQNHIHFFDHEDQELPDDDVEIRDAEGTNTRGSMTSPRSSVNRKRISPPQSAVKVSPEGTMVQLRHTVDRVNNKRHHLSMANYQVELTNLSAEIRQYREGLNRAERAEFDLLWGLDEQGCFKTGTAGEASRSIASKSVNVHQAVLTDLKKINEQVQKELVRFPEGGGGQGVTDRSSLTHDQRKFDRELGKRLLFLFQCDLLPGISGKILQSKGARDNVIVKPVSRWAFISSCAILVLANVGMLFYIFLFAVNQTTKRQSAWFQSFIMWLIIEICFVSTMVALITHVVIPLMSMKDVAKIKQRLLDNIRDFYSKISDDTVTDQHGGVKPFNAAKYLFVSSRLAEHHPAIRESKIIRAFSTPWPKQSYQHFTDVSKSYSKKFTSINRSVVFVVLFFVTNMLNVPHALQDMFIHMTATSAMGYTILLHIELFHIFPVLAFGPFLVCCVVAHFMIQSGRASAKKRLAQLMPLNEKLNHLHDVKQSVVKDGDKKDNGNSREMETIKTSLVHVNRRDSIVKGLGVIQQMHHDLIDREHEQEEDDDVERNSRSASRDSLDEEGEAKKSHRDPHRNHHNGNNSRSSRAGEQKSGSPKSATATATAASRTAKVVPLVEVKIVSDNSSLGVSELSEGLQKQQQQQQRSVNRSVVSEQDGLVVEHLDSLEEFDRFTVDLGEEEEDLEPLHKVRSRSEIFSESPSSNVSKGSAKIPLATRHDLVASGTIESYDEDNFTVDLEHSEKNDEEFDSGHDDDSSEEDSVDGDLEEELRLLALYATAAGDYDDAEFDRKLGQWSPEMY